jgi:hypothetical protein
VSDRSCDCKTRTGTHTNWRWRGRVTCCNYKTRARKTYNLEAEREGDVSDRSFEYKTRTGTRTTWRRRGRARCQIAVATRNRGQGHVHCGGGERERRVRSWLRLQTRAKTQEGERQGGQEIRNMDRTISKRAFSGAMVQRSTLGSSSSKSRCLKTSFLLVSQCSLECNVESA